MTQVQAMMDEKLEFSLAELLGWENAWDGIRLIWIDRETKEFRHKVTDWHPASDPAASLEVQTAAITKDKNEFLNNLTGVVAGYFPKTVNWDIEWENDVIILLISASHRQTAEAAYITLSQIEQQMQGEPCCLVGRCEECDPITDDENHL